MESNTNITLKDHVEVGSGSYGKVYTGTYDKKRYAVKRRYIADYSPPGCVHVSEVDALCRFKHPYIVKTNAIQRQNPIADNFRSDHKNSMGYDEECSYRADLIYVLTEAADGDLWGMIRKPVSIDVARKWISQILLALLYIHESGFIHRDIKPHNVLYYEATDSVKLCDFDMILPSIEGLCSFKAMTPEYTPPEVLAQGADVDYSPKVDVWGAGMVLKFLLSGAHLLDRGPRTGDKMDTYLLSLQKKYFPNGESMTCPAIDVDTEVNPLTGIDEVDDLLSHMLDCDPKTRWDARRCLEHPFLKVELPLPIKVPDHIVESHYITDEMAKVFDAEISSLTENQYFAFFLGLDILMRVCRTKYRGDHRKLAICCYNIGMKYYYKNLARTIPIDANDAKAIEYRVIVEKLQGEVYRDTVYNHIQSEPMRIYRYMFSPMLFPRPLTELVTGIQHHLDNIKQKE